MSNLQTISKNEIEKTVDGKKYVVRSVYVGTKDIQKTILELAVKKASKDMGLA
jgi:hypothetical protein